MRTRLVACLVSTAFVAVLAGPAGAGGLSHGRDTRSASTSLIENHCKGCKG
jgi:hypothetical protein